MEIKNSRLIISGRHIMLAAAYISGLCGIYWLYRIIFHGEAQWLSFVMTSVISCVLFYLSKKRE